MLAFGVSLLSITWYGKVFVATTECPFPHQEWCSWHDGESQRKCPHLRRVVNSTVFCDYDKEGSDEC